VGKLGRRVAHALLPAAHDATVSAGEGSSTRLRRARQADDRLWAEVLTFGACDVLAALLNASVPESGPARGGGRQSRSGVMEPPASGTG